MLCFFGAENFFSNLHRRRNLLYLLLLLKCHRLFECLYFQLCILQYAPCAPSSLFSFYNQIYKKPPNKTKETKSKMLICSVSSVQRTSSPIFIVEDFSCIYCDCGNVFDPTSSSVINSAFEENLF